MPLHCLLVLCTANIEPTPCLTVRTVSLAPLYISAFGSQQNAAALSRALQQEKSFWKHLAASQLSSDIGTG
jgi:hypothetical protein